MKDPHPMITSQSSIKLPTHSITWIKLTFRTTDRHQRASQIIWSREGPNKGKMPRYLKLKNKNLYCLNQWSRKEIVKSSLSPSKNKWLRPKSNNSAAWSSFRKRTDRRWRQELLHVQTFRTSSAPEITTNLVIFSQLNSQKGCNQLQGSLTTCLQLTTRFHILTPKCPSYRLKYPKSISNWSPSPKSHHRLTLPTPLGIATSLKAQLVLNR